MENTRYTTKKYWDSQREKNRFQRKYHNPGFSGALERILPYNNEFSVAEVGAYPGDFLCYFNRKFGYKPVAIEYSRYYYHIGELLESNGIKDYRLINIDFFNFSGEQFDVVSSFGFVEHFNDLSGTIKHHVDLLKNNGYLVIGIPYFGGLQGWIRRVFLKPEVLEEIKNTHNLDSMNMDSLRNSIEENGLKILYAKYEMKSKIWLSFRDDTIRRNRRVLMALVNILEKSVRFLLPSSRYWSPYILVIARKEERQ